MSFPKHRLYMSHKFFLMFSGAMLLPPLGGILDLFDSTKARFDAVHFGCLAAYAVYFVWLNRFLSRKLEVTDAGLTITDWLRTTSFDFGESTKIAELKLPTPNQVNGRFDYLPHLFVGDGARQVLIQADYLQRYPELKTEIEEKSRQKIESIQVEKSGWVKSVEFLEWVGLLK